MLFHIASCFSGLIQYLRLAPFYYSLMFHYAFPCLWTITKFNTNEINLISPYAIQSIITNLDNKMGGKMISKML